MKEFEFYSYDDKVLFRNGEGNPEVFSEHNVEMVEKLYELIKKEFPDAYEALCEIYGKSKPNITYYRYVVVKRFIKCNFSKIDTTYMDMESVGNDDRMNFERVDCPLRGECPFEDIICKPRFSSSLTKRELDVARYWYEGKRKEEIAEMMFLSYDTINNHIRRIYRKLGVHSEAEFVRYVDSKHIF